MNQSNNDIPQAGNGEGYIPLSPTVKQNVKDGIVALALAVWIMIRPWSHLLIDQDRYYFKEPVTSAELGAMLFNFFWIGLAIWLGIRLWRRAQSKILLFALDLAFLALLIFPIDYLRVQVFTLHFGGVGGLVKNPAVLALLAVVGVLVLWKHRPIARVVAVILGVTSPAAAWVIVRIALTCAGLTHVRNCDVRPPSPPLLPVRASQPRVLWIIFDETDYRLAFEKRPAWVKLPEFDRLRNESLSADHAYSPGSSTIISMPALITGQRLATVGHDDCDLTLTRMDDGVTTDFSETPDVFSAARDLGFNTALVGWYHPYSRVLGRSLNYSSWYPYPGFEIGRAADFSSAVHEQLEALSGHADIRRLFIKTCRNSFKDALSVATNKTYGMILLHMPPPHAPGVYVAATHRFTMWGVQGPAGYFNNLMLADEELGQFRAAMEKTGLWDKTWLILSADHWWRQSQTYDGLVDHRVPYLVKSPGASHHIGYSHQFNTVLTHDLILDILRGQITNQAGAAALLDTGAPDLPVIHTGEGTE